MLADHGWDVTFLGTGATGAADNFAFPPHQNISIKRWRFRGPGILQKLQFIAFCLWVLREVRRTNTRWIYASDPLASPAALLAIRLLGCRAIYHEHDSPSRAPSGPGHRISAYERFILYTRGKLAGRAALCILPNEARADVFKRQTATTRPVYCVWNCPDLLEVTSHVPQTAAITTLYYHGSLNRDCFPTTILDALRRLPDTVRLEFAGYTTTGNQNFVLDFLAEARRLGVQDRVTYLGAFSRPELLRHCARATIGLALVPNTSQNINMRAMTGASNKAFDYLACGLALLVSDLPDWRMMFVEAGYAVGCNPESSASISEAISSLMKHPRDTALLRTRGRQKILEEWNYQTQFAPVLQFLLRQ